MSEIRVQDVFLVGRLVGNPIPIKDECFFQVQAEENQPPFPCFCKGKTAANMKAYLKADDEVSIEGKLHWRKFAGEKSPTLLVLARFISYGRKARNV